MAICGAAWGQMERSLRRGAYGYRYPLRARPDPGPKRPRGGPAGGAGRTFFPVDVVFASLVRPDPSSKEAATAGRETVAYSPGSRRRILVPKPAPESGPNGCRESDACFCLVVGVGFWHPKGRLVHPAGPDDVDDAEAKLPPAPNIHASSKRDAHYEMQRAVAKASGGSAGAATCTSRPGDVFILEKRRT